jgi:hypothetical protein
MTYLRHWYFLLLVSLRLAMAFAQASGRLQRKAFQDLGLREADVLTSKEKKRFRHYYYGTTYLAVLFCVRLGRRRSMQEQCLFSNLAALACFFDDLVDASRNANDADFLWHNNPEAYGRAVDPRGLSLHFLKNIYDHLPPEHLEEFRALLHRVFHVELFGIQETVDKNILQNRRFSNENERLAFLTAEKGGCSVLLFRRLMTPPIAAEEYVAWYEFGYLIQLCDDIFDLWHDRQAGIATLATFFAERNQVAELRAMFERQVIVVVNAFHNSVGVTSSHPDTLSRFTEQVRAGIHFLIAITRVCLAHYADLQKKHGTLPLDDRKAMVVDMDRWRHRISTARELLKKN